MYRYTLGIDLAASASAAVKLTPAAEVVWQEFIDDDLTSAKLSFLQHCAYAATTSPTLVIVEDVPAGVMNTLSYRDQCRMQGMLLAVFKVPVMWVLPNVWKKHFGIHRMKGKTPAKEKCIELGYIPPPEAHGKSLTDCRDAFLIAKYGLDACG